MRRLLLPSALLVLLGTASCSEGDLCAQAPRCDGSEALNCEPSCSVGPCSTGPSTFECEDDLTCTVVPGDLDDPRFFRSRAVCAESLSACDPAVAEAPRCEGSGLPIVVGCSAYRRVIHVPCSQAGLYFAQSPACCRSGADAGTDAGTDAGVGDGGLPDAGAPRGDAGR